MARKSRRFTRPLGERSYRRLFIISAEGTITEPSYFLEFNNYGSVIRIRCLKTNHRSAPQYVLKRLMEYLKQ